MNATIIDQSDNPLVRFARTVLLTFKILYAIAKEPVIQHIYMIALLITGWIACAHTSTSVIALVLLSILFAIITVIWAGTKLQSGQHSKGCNYLNVPIARQWAAHAPNILAVLVIGAGTVNIQWLKDSNYETLVDGKPVTGEQFRFVSPLATKVRVERDQSIKGVWVDGTTKDGASIKAQVSATLRLTEDPDAWAPASSTREALERVILDRFRASAKQFEIKDVTSGNLAMAFKFGAAEEYPLPSNAKWNGEVTIDGLKVFFRDPA